MVPLTAGYYPFCVFALPDSNPARIDSIWLGSPGLIAVPTRLKHAWHGDEVYVGLWLEDNVALINVEHNFYDSKGDSPCAIDQRKLFGCCTANVYNPSNQETTR